MSIFVSKIGVGIGLRKDMLFPSFAFCVVRPVFLASFEASASETKKLTKQ